MKPFMDADFLLQTDTAKTLYHEAAEKMPIFDYHNHLNPQEILEDRQMENLTRVWRGGRTLRCAWGPIYVLADGSDLLNGWLHLFFRNLLFLLENRHTLLTFLPYTIT